MGKRKGRKRKKKNRLYNKKQFVGIFCAKCGLCIGDPTFCYTEVYRTDPKEFINNVFKRLLEIKKWNEDRGRSSADKTILVDVEQFKYVFCKSLTRSCGLNIEHDHCDLINNCWRAFSNQVFGAEATHAGRNKKRKKKKTKRYIIQPYPTLFTSDNDGWIAFVRELFNENINFEQDKVTQSSPEFAESTDQRAKTAES